ncbi:YceD family protein [Roseobacter sp. HKCCA0434]|uniref:YceD family protein n=1 Tax=Roseobacter sp. HKCCA0434 TaxID=3079297 RepID=UPI002905A0D2|nr:YceD family protein [Roseobacter sp. HKCCA0434]
MPTTNTTRIEFSRPLMTQRLMRDGRHPFEESATDAERAELAVLFDATEVRAFTLTGEVRPDGDGLTLDARLRAEVVQPCVVSLRPVTTTLDEPVKRHYDPALDPEAVDLDIEAEEEVEPLPRTLDLGLVAIEAAALALPAYPRHPDAGDGDRIADDGAQDAEREKPFAALAALKEKLADKG